MSEAPRTLDGWWALHDLRRVDWPSWLALDPTGRREALDEALAFFRRAEAVGADDGSSALYAVLGHKGDLMQIHLRPTPEALSELEAAFDRTMLAAHLERTTSYLSVVELSTYGTDAPEDPLKNERLRERLHPRIPPARHMSFYPMDKRRGEQENWYLLPMEERRRMMVSHGQIGRSYAGRVKQMITGSVGLDDWEWGVTLFADDPLAFKHLVYEMRFDEVSARYAEFGPFYVGIRKEPAELRTYLDPEAAAGRP